MKVYNILSIFAVILLVILSTNLVLAGESCQPDQSYDWCYTNSYGGATAKVQGTNAQGHFYSSGGVNYAVPLTGETEIFYNVDYTGTKFYVYNPISSWNDVSCDENGCDGEQISRGKYSVGSVGNDYNKCLAFVSWKKKTYPDNSWEYAWAGYGWLSCGTRHIVACYNDGNCQTDYYCDKTSSDWKQWSCKTKTVPQTCTNGDKKNTTCTCGKAYTSANCVNGAWVPIQFYLDPCISLCSTNCTSSQPSNTCGIDNCNISYDKCNANYTCTDNQCQLNTEPVDTWGKIKEIANTKIFNIGSFEIKLWYLLALLLFFLLFIRR